VPLVRNLAVDGLHSKRPAVIIYIKRKEVHRQSQQNFFLFFRDLLYCTTCFGQLGHFQVITTVCQIRGVN
jgi:hypothetical protein